MSSKLQVIALISGGKDSLFSILHCLKNGHDVVALANLHPPPPDSGPPDAGDEGDDINSFMYQTVGHSIVPLYEQALKLPLYRQPILGAAVNTDKDYHHDARPQPPVSASASVSAAASSSAPRQVDAAAAKLTSASSAADDDSIARSAATNTSRGHDHDHGPGPGDDSGDAGGDETESLVPLLRRVLAAHPSANAVCTGAILSTYQRTRVESVCARLGLVPLGYLWQYPALPPYRDAQLLRDMAAVAQDARIVKVASGGLDAGFLWRNVAEDRVVLMLRRAAARFGGEGAVLGEGGEFETVAVDGPGCVWKGGRIEVEVDDEAVLGEGGNAVVRFRRARVVEKAGGDDDGLENLRVPGLLDSEFEELGRSLLSNSSERTLSSSSQTVEQSLAATTLSNESTTPPTNHLQPHITLHGTTLTISNLTAPPAADGTPLPPTAQLTAITSRLRALLSAHAATPAHITSTTLLLRSMADFASLNPVYGALFAASPNPPARVTVACGPALPAAVSVALSCTVSLCPRPHRRRGLHVQSRSYWAPANIGPYSQAIAAPAAADAEVEVVSLAGQIPLVPASMEVVRAADVAAVAAALGAGDAVDGFVVQTMLALQHLWRVGRAMGVRWWGCGTAFVAAAGGQGAGGARARVVREAWRGAHELMRPPAGDGEGSDDGGGVDVWDLKYGNAAGRGFGGGAALGEEVDGRLRLPDFEGVRWEGEGEGEDDGVLAPPCIVAQVLELPRAVDVEWTAPGLTNCGGVVLSRREGARTRLKVYETKVGGGVVAFYAAGLASAEGVWELEDVLEGAKVPAEGRVYTVYMAKPLPEEWLEKAMPLVVPCGRVWGPDGNEVAAAVTVRYCG
ncbi:atp-binding endoribonuclease [Neofusicoccum parvum]|uniref:Atp-binding endoribonuclease n=1 Tax=Neofusicoccum parvum TaxID=310453 RepID=A0ACB5RVV5_9PEZI|nr:atp-binding endoribonuclease [Neofusicoccum parvum]